MEQIEDRGIREGREPCNVLEVIHPGSNRICPGWNGSTSIETDLGCIRSQLDPIVHERTETCQRPDDTEQGHVSELLGEKSSVHVSQRSISK